MKHHTKALQWAIEDLTSRRKVDVLSHKIVVETSYSIVYQIDTSQGLVYLKQVPKPLFLEPYTLRFLHESQCRHIPEVIAENKQLQCFITTSCGDISLRHLFQGQINMDMLKRGIDIYTNIQRQLEDKTDALLAMKLPDWRLHQFPTHYEALINKTSLLKHDGLTSKEIEQLHKLVPTCVRLCEKIAQYKIQETISHCDIHENNMLLDKKTKAINIIDWGETVVTHPFFSLNGCLWNITYFNKIKPSDTEYHELQSQCVSMWSTQYDNSTLLKILNLTRQLLGIYAALSYERLYQMTQNESYTVQQEHPGSIAGCLRSFLSDVSISKENP